MWSRGVLAVIAALIIGCASQVSVSDRNVDLALEQSHLKVKAGETVTFTARASGIAGRDETIRWESSGGELKHPNQMNRYAQVTYPHSGTYAVIAKLLVDGRTIDQERAIVTVEPLG